MLQLMPVNIDLFSFIPVSRQISEAGRHIRVFPVPFLNMFSVFFPAVGSRKMLPVPDTLLIFRRRSGTLPLAGLNRYH